MQTAAGFMVIFLVACSGSEGSEPCDLANRDGTYLQSFSEHKGGNCGALPDQVIVIDGDALTLDDGCVRDAPDKVSADQCDITSSFTCPLDDGRGTVSVVAFLSESRGGATISGVLTMRIVDSAGAFVCTSTYDVSHKRQ